MSGKPKLYYFNGRVKWSPYAGCLRQLGLSLKKSFGNKGTYEALLHDGALLFQQVPMVEIDGMKLVQTKAILQYIAAKHNLYGKDLTERALIDMYVEGTTDLMEIIIWYPFIEPELKEGHLNKIQEKAKNRYFPVYEKILRDHGEKYLVGNRLSWADVHLLEAILMVEEKCADILTHFPLLKVFKTRISEIPTIKAFLQPGSQRKPVPDKIYVETVRTVLQLYRTAPST